MMNYFLILFYNFTIIFSLLEEAFFTYAAKE